MPHWRLPPEREARRRSGRAGTRRPATVEADQGDPGIGGTTMSRALSGPNGAPHRVMVRRAVPALLLLAVAAACVPTPPPSPPDPAPPVVERFAAVARRTEAPVTATLVWSVSDPNGDVLTCRVDLDEDGVADRIVSPCRSGDSILVGPADPGEHTFGLEVDDGSSPPVVATTSLTVAPGPSEGFGITLRIAPGMPAQFRAAFEDAAARWSEVIVAGWPDRSLTVPDGFLGWIPGYDGPVDDVVIAARDVDIDGPRGVLGAAGALLYRESGEPMFGIMQFDTADLEMLAERGRLTGVILHEMGHVLGIGGNWLLEGRIDNLLFDPTYNGAAGVAAWRELGGSGGVPVENQGGLGTLFGHWRESVFGHELMTGYSDPDEALSRLTIAALADRGYGVDLTAADPYTLPGLAAARRGDDLGIGHADPVAPYPGERLPGT